MPLPLRANRIPVKFVRVLRGFDRVNLANIWLFELQYRLTRAVAIGVGADHWKTVFPNRRLQMNDAAVRPLVLKVQKPPFAGRRIDKGSLMRAVDRGFTLSQHDLSLVRAVDAF